MFQSMQKMNKKLKSELDFVKEESSHVIDNLSSKIYEQ